MAKEKLEKKSNPWVGHKIRKILMGTALAATLFTWAGCDNGGWKWKDKNTPDIEQILNKNSNWIVKNSDWTYCIYYKWKKVSWDYSEIYSDYNWYYKWLRGSGHKDILNERWEVLVGNWEYDDISLWFVTSKWVLWIIATKEWKDFLIIMDWHEPFWPIDEIFRVKVVEWTENWIAIIGKNNWKTVLYYDWKQVWELPAQYNHDCMALTLESVKLINGKLSYIIYNENENPTIVYWNKKIKAKYPMVDNLQEYNWNIVYVWWNYGDWDITDIAIVSGDKVTKINAEDEKLMLDPKTNLAFYL
jgi:hypothetical protein